jgi:fructose-1,6-bisphosphatase I
MTEFGQPHVDARAHLQPSPSQGKVAAMRRSSRPPARSPAVRSKKGWSLDRHILERQREIPGANGDFTLLFQQIALAGKIIASRVNQAGLAGVLGLTGETNVQGERVRKLDEYANNIIIRSVEAGGNVCIMGSEEVAEPIAIPSEYPTGKYVLLFDPLDGSTNIDVNVSIGTIFSIFRRVTPAGPGRLEDCLQPGRHQVAAGYILYGSSTMLVYTAGEGVYGFTLDPSVGEFFLSHENMRIPERAPIYSINEGNSSKWYPSVKNWVNWLKTPDDEEGRPYASRYVGTLVADFHRTLIRGGVFAYPADMGHAQGKLRLLYEASPLAFIAEVAGGAASTGAQRILDIAPSELHQRVPLIIGSKRDVEDACRFMSSFEE